MQTRPQKEKVSIGQKQLALRNKLWPSIKDEKLWLRKSKTGFTTIPRTMPLIMEIMDSMSNGKPVSTTYLDLWCRAYDECFVTLNKHREMAFHAGYSGQRAEQTWSNRISILTKLNFIDVKAGPSGPFSYALMVQQTLSLEQMLPQLLTIPYQKKIGLIQNGKMRGTA